MSKSKINKDLTAVKKKLDGMYPWDYAAPTKDQAHSGVLSCGDNYGVAHRVPVGKEHAGGMESGPIPQESRCWSPKEVFHGEDKRG